MLAIYIDFIGFSPFQWTFAMSRGIDSTAGEWSGARSEFIPL
ncbi:hypothetical protein MiSe_45420 [Microseira wollei NIES-4236]|uniref:Uncharacterized protein n=1 Tax=Microseira wollei NIES-4236 TaxID=2530354 RepID=A0AAV3XD18_9CYAN|nr:hypothetical protein MiSe_45420 [Microseira wollei NIES-4236]